MRSRDSSAAGGSEGPATAILLYHRMAEPEADVWSLAVSPARFAAQIDAIMARYEVVPLESANNPGPPGRRVVITFDDGYADNLDAAQLLADRGLPATFFLTSGQLDSNREYWWDELARSLLDEPVLTRAIALDVGGDRLVLELDGEPPPRKAWRAWLPPQGRREEAYLELYRRLRRADIDEREAVLEALSEQVGVGRDARPTMRPLTREETLELAALKGVEIGAHTAAHVQLSCLSLDRQRDEIVGSRRDLAAITGHQAQSFSYPYGARGSDYGADAIAIVAAEGFRSACASEGGVTGPHESPHDLSRLMVSDWEPDALLQVIEDTFDDKPQRTRRVGRQAMRRAFRRIKPMQARELTHGG